MNPIQSRVLHTFQASNPYELTIRANQQIFVAPREVQNTHRLLNTGWLLATVDKVSSGIIPVNYIEAPTAKPPTWTPPTSIPTPSIPEELTGDVTPDFVPIQSINPTFDSAIAPKITDIPQIQPEVVSIPSPVTLSNE